MNRKALQYVMLLTANTVDTSIFKRINFTRTDTASYGSNQQCYYQHSIFAHLVRFVHCDNFLLASRDLLNWCDVAPTNIFDLNELSEMFVVFMRAIFNN